jgi:hypothetical protein
MLKRIAIEVLHLITCGICKKNPASPQDSEMEDDGYSISKRRLNKEGFQKFLEKEDKKKRR